MISLAVTICCAYPLSRPTFRGGKYVMALCVVTMYFNGGLIPTYLLVRDLGLLDSFWALALPGSLSIYNMIVMRTYIIGLPDALVESGRIDGAGDFYLFWRIIFPLMMPVAATIALFVAVGAWNAWFDTHLYNAGKVRLHTLQYLLKMKLATTSNSANAAMTSAEAAANTTLTTPITIRAAITVVSAAPIMAIYPFLQRYFVTGLTLGSVKG